MNYEYLETEKPMLKKLKDLKKLKKENYNRRHERRSSKSPFNKIRKTWRRFLQKYRFTWG